jgi:hypothetical protein
MEILILPERRVGLHQIIKLYNCSYRKNCQVLIMLIAPTKKRQCNPIEGHFKILHSGSFLSASTECTQDLRITLLLLLFADSFSQMDRKSVP